MAESKVVHGMRMERNYAALLVDSEEAVNDSDKSFTIPGASGPSGTKAELWQIFNIRIEFTASATGGTRKFTVLVTDADDDVLQSFDLDSRTNVTATNSLVVDLIPGAAYANPDSAATSVRDYLPPNLFLGHGEILRVYDRSATDAAADDMVVHVRAMRYLHI